MEKINFTFQKEKDEQQVQACIQQLQKHPLICHLLKNGSINSQTIVQYPFKLARLMTSYEPCLTCKGLKMCQQKLKGYYDSIYDDGQLQYEKCACKYLKEYQFTTKHLSNFVYSEMPETMQQNSLRDMDYQKLSDAFVSAVDQTISLIQENHKGGYIVGTLGSGKTYLASALINDYARDGRKVAFVHLPTFCSKISTYMFSEEKERLLSLLCYVDILVMDDIGAEMVNDYLRDQILMPILDHRMANQKMTWFTSNYSFDGLESHYSTSSYGKVDSVKATRLVERIRVLSQPIELNDLDHRL